MLKKEIQEVFEDYKETYNSVPEEKIPEILYNYYAETYTMEHEDFWRAYNALRAISERVPPHLRDSVLDAATALANVQERNAFLAGMRFAQELE